MADYIDQQFEQYFRDESGLNRKNIQDNRVHCCIYFISPFGHGYRHPLPALLGWGRLGKGLGGTVLSRLPPQPPAPGCGVHESPAPAGEHRAGAGQG